MPHDPRKLLNDILDSVERILEWTRGKKLSEYENDELLSDAVERNFIIIGEAMSRLHRVDAAMASQLGDYPQIIGFQNVVVHGYDVLEDAIVWGIIENELPRLRDRTRTLLTNP